MLSVRMHTVYKFLLRYDTEAEQVKNNMIKWMQKSHQHHNGKNYGPNLKNVLKSYN